MRSRSFVSSLLIFALALISTSIALAGDSFGADIPASDDGQVSQSSAVIEDASALASASLLADLESFLHQRKVDVDQLTVDDAVGVMIDWYRATPFPTTGDGATDMLLFRYGGWSEGCATGFNVSLLRRAGDRGTAGITLMFEPSGGAELKGFATALPNRELVEPFLDAVHASPAFQQFGTARPMGVSLERGGLR